ncbi:hypothetical protein BV25DRAFT_1827365 [Artomyces pyxidatus]|uniref:Uncharacterized protein n=1 Tax=Artomyces pyxidatus TaxID=48021 RepID=A0ACB8SX87_9AGAM|nr:hypothetical protein BV25DRAFT_1827365 [Artomyces pyxidatus]
MSSAVSSPLASPAAEPAVEKKPRSSRSKAASTATPKKTKTVAARKAVPRKVNKAAPAEHPSWKDIVKECIADNLSDARSGVSRTTLKKFAEEKYKIDMSQAANLYQLNRAINNGAEKGVFFLPKGPSGKVKLAPKQPKVAAESKEVRVSTADTIQANPSLFRTRSPPHRRSLPTPP